MVNAIDGANDDGLLLAFRDRVFHASEESIEWSTAPIAHFDVKRGHLVEVRTGIFLQVADAQFLVTAAHGMNDHWDDGRSPCVVMPDKSLKPVPLVREHFHTTINEHEDICVTRLVDSTVTALGAYYRYLRLSDMMSMHHEQQYKGLVPAHGISS